MWLSIWVPRKYSKQSQNQRCQDQPKKDNHITNLIPSPIRTRAGWQTGLGRRHSRHRLNAMLPVYQGTNRIRKQRHRTQSRILLVLLRQRGREETVLLETVEPSSAATITEEEIGAKYEAERHRPGLVSFTDGSRTKEGATGYAVSSATHHLQVSILRVTSDNPEPGQKYAIAARRHIAEGTSRNSVERSRTSKMVCPSHCEVEGSEKADEWVVWRVGLAARSEASVK